MASAEAQVKISADGVELDGALGVPPLASGIVVFAHGSGSSRLSPRNTHVAGVLRHAGIATLLFDLLTPREAADRSNVFDIDLLAGRLRDVTRWVRHQSATQRLRIGYFGASTGAAAALLAASTDRAVGAVVSRGGRPDLAMSALPQVAAPTLLIVGGDDRDVLRLNEQALALLRCEKELRIVPRAGHLFEEPGALKEVTRLATDWLSRHLGAPGPQG